MAEWVWLYLRNEQGARLITGDVEAMLERGRHTPLFEGAAESRKKKQVGSWVYKLA